MDRVVSPTAGTSRAAASSVKGSHQPPFRVRLNKETRHLSKTPIHPRAVGQRVCPLFGKHVQLCAPLSKHAASASVPHSRPLSQLEPGSLKLMVPAVEKHCRTKYRASTASRPSMRRPSCAPRAPTSLSVSRGRSGSANRWTTAVHPQRLCGTNLQMHLLRLAAPHSFTGSLTCWRRLMCLTATPTCLIPPRTCVLASVVPQCVAGCWS